jgi:hypothetical protein
MSAPPIGKRGGRGRDYRFREDNNVMLVLVRIRERGNASYAIEFRGADKVWWRAHRMDSYADALRCLDDYARATPEQWAAWTARREPSRLPEDA